MPDLLLAKRREDAAQLGQAGPAQRRQSLGTQADDGRCQLRRQVFAPQHQQRDVRPVRQQGRTRLGLLQRQAIGSVVNLPIDADQAALHRQPGVEQIAGVGVHHRQAQWLECRQQARRVLAEQLRLRQAQRRAPTHEFSPQCAAAGQLQ